MTPLEKATEKWENDFPVNYPSSEDELAAFKDGWDAAIKWTANYATCHPDPYSSTWIVDRELILDVLSQ